MSVIPADCQQFKIEQKSQRNRIDVCMCTIHVCCGAGQSETFSMQEVPWRSLWSWGPVSILTWWNCLGDAWWNCLGEWCHLFYMLKLLQLHSHSFQWTHPMFVFYPEFYEFIDALKSCTESWKCADFTETLLCCVKVVTVSIIIVVMYDPRLGRVSTLLSICVKCHEVALPQIPEETTCTNMFLALRWCIRCYCSLCEVPVKFLDKQTRRHNQLLLNFPGQGGRMGGVKYFSLRLSICWQFLLVIFQLPWFEDEVYVPRVSIITLFDKYSWA